MKKNIQSVLLPRGLLLRLSGRLAVGQEQPREQEHVRGYEGRERQAEAAPREVEGLSHSLMGDGRFSFFFQWVDDCENRFHFFFSSLFSFDLKKKRHSFPRFLLCSSIEPAPNTSERTQKEHT